MAVPTNPQEQELQGAIQATVDPQSTITADDAEKLLVQQSQSAGIPAFSFDPDASVSEKRAQVHAAIPNNLKRPQPKGVSIVSDADMGDDDTADLPSPTAEGAIEVAKDAEGKPIMNGSDPIAPHDVPYSRTGWAPRFGWPEEKIQEAESMLDHSTWLEGRVPNQFYGDWYHNAAVIVFACLASWLVAVFGGGLAWVTIIMAICSTYYRTSIRRVRRNFRDDITREMALKKLETDSESLEWINSFLVKFWPIYQPVLAETIINSVDQVLSSATPAFLDSLKLKTFTLGSKPPRMEHVKTYPKTEDDIVIMDWRFSFTPNDTVDMTARQITNKINPKVILEIRVGKAMISKGLDVIVEDMSFSGIMRLKVKLQIPFPHVEKVEMCFLERPTIDYVCKPLGGDMFGFDINFIPGLEAFILEQIHGNLALMMYAPNVFPIEVAKMLAGTPVDQAIGVIAVTLHGAYGLKNSDNFGGTIDPYAVFTLNRRRELARTKVVKNSPNPRWNETHYIIVTSFNDSLDMQFYDYNDIRKHKELGVASFPLEDIEELNVLENQRIDVMLDGKTRGYVSCDIRFFPVLEPTKTGDGKEEPVESDQGILRFTVEQAKDLDGTKSLVGLLNPYAILHLNGREVHTTKKLKRTNNPIWDNGAKEMLITDRKKAKLGVTIKDDRDLAGDQVLGKYQIKLDDLLQCMDEGKDWFHLAGAQTGRVKMRAQWKPVEITDVSGGTGGYVTPIGVMRFHFMRANNLRNFEALGKSDPYVRILMSGIQRARTVTFKNDLNPEWDEVLYLPVHSSRERVTLEVMDAEKVGKDRSLGLVDVNTGEYVVQNEETGEYAVHDEKKILQRGLKLHGKGMEKGILTYTVAFYPCLNIADPEDDEEEGKNKEKGEEAATTNGEDKKGGNKTSSASSTAEVNGDDTAVGRGSHESSSLSAEKTRTSLSLDSTRLRSSLDSTGGPQSSMSPTRRKPLQPPKIRLTPEELLQHNSGFVIFHIMESELPQANTRLEVYVDDMAYPSYISSTAQSKVHTFDEIGDCFIREMDWSRLTLCVREKSDKPEEGDKEKTIARLSSNTNSILKQCLNNPTYLMLKDDDGQVGRVKVSLKYLPVRMDLDPSESINNMGSLRVDLISGKNLPAADSNGKSDPFCRFELNGQEVYKSKTQKKTLNPIWNEFFEVTVPSRTAAKFQIKVYDYDFADKPDFLGDAWIDLRDIELFRMFDRNVLLSGESGSIQLRMRFTPSYVTRMRQGTSAFAGTFASAPGRIVTGVAGAPVKAVGVVSLGVGKGASFLRRGFRNRKEEEPIPEIPVITTTPSAGPPSTPNGASNAVDSTVSGDDASKSPGTSPFPAARNGSGASLRHTRTRSVGGASAHSAQLGAAQMGTVQMTVVSAAGFPAGEDVFVALSVGDPKAKPVAKTKSLKVSTSGTVRFEENFKFACSPETPVIVKVYEDHIFRSDELLGQTTYYVDETGTAREKEIPVKDGNVVVKSTFVPPMAGESGSATDSPKSAVRRGFRGIRSVSREGSP